MRRFEESGTTGGQDEIEENALQPEDTGIPQPPLRCPLPPRPLRGEEGRSEAEASVLLIHCRLQILDFRFFQFAI